MGQVPRHHNLTRPSMHFLWTTGKSHQLPLCVCLRYPIQKFSYSMIGHLALKAGAELKIHLSKWTRRKHKKCYCGLPHSYQTNWNTDIFIQFLIKNMPVKFMIGNPSTQWDGNGTKITSCISVGLVSPIQLSSLVSIWSTSGDSKKAEEAWNYQIIFIQLGKVEELIERKTDL